MALPRKARNLRNNQFALPPRCNTLAARYLPPVKYHFDNIIPMKRFLFLALISCSISLTQGQKLAVYGNVGANKSISELGWTPAFVPMPSFALGLGYYHTFFRQDVGVHLGFQKLWCLMNINRSYETSDIRLANGNDFNLLTADVSLGLLKNAEKTHMLQLHLGLALWKLVAVSQSYNISSFGTSSTDYEWSFVHPPFNNQWQPGFAAKLEYQRKWTPFNWQALYFTSSLAVLGTALPAMGVEWRVNQQDAYAVVTPHYPLMLSVGVKKYWSINAKKG